ncbi:MAG: hypothetical protein WA584_08340 [Pyrinomonadaceae bacterium]
MNVGQVTAKNVNLDSEDTEKFTLYVEDDYDSRNAVLGYLRDKNYHDIIAPTSIAECVEAIESKRFNRAVIDNNLSHWVDRNTVNSIKIGNRECYNGIQLAKVLEYYNYNIQIGLFSSHTYELQNAIKSWRGDSSFEILKVERGSPNKHILDFIERNYKLEITIKPLHKIKGELPNAIQAFYAKKIINLPKTKDDLWKAGEYAWLVGVNKDISHRFAKIEKSNKYTLDNPEEEFLITIDKNDSDVESIIDKSTDTEINFKNILTKGSIPKSDKFIYSYFITQAICKKYLTNQVGIEKVIKTLKSLGESAMFESQKILFKKLPQTVTTQINHKEEVYELLKEFSSSHFPKILDIYKCRVDFVEDGVAHVKLESFSPEKAVRVERFSTEFLNNHNIDENSFEYTIYIPPIGGGSAFHIEPI